MKLVFFSNYFNSHQKPLAYEFIKILGAENYKFVATEHVEKNLNLSQVGAEFDNDPCVFKYYERPDEARKIINEADCVIIAGLPVGLVRERLAAGKLTFMHSERFFKGPFSKDLVRFFKYSLYSGGRKAARDSNSKFFLLSAGAFVTGDYKICGLFKNKAYKWAYFPEHKNYSDIKNLIARKNKNSILWVNRLIDWKHPELAVRLAKNLKALNLNFSLKIIGDGPELEGLKNLIDSLSLRDCVNLAGHVPRDEVRAEMERAGILISTSDKHEGWGATISEGMSSGCAVVAGNKIGAVPFLIQNNFNGLIFKDRDLKDLSEKVAGLLKNPEKVSLLGLAAYESMSRNWNAPVAAKRFIEFCDALQAGKAINFPEGPLAIDN